MPDRRPTLEITYGSLYGFVLSGTPLQMADPGDAAQYQVTVSPTGGFNTAVSFQVGNVPAGVNVTVPPGTVAPPGSKNITISHTNPSQTVGGLYAVPITVTGDGIERTMNLYLLVNGSQQFLPLVER